MWFHSVSVCTKLGPPMSKSVELTERELREIEIALMNGRTAMVSVDARWPSDEWKKQQRQIENALRIIANKRKHHVP